MQAGATTDIAAVPAGPQARWRRSRLTLALLSALAFVAGVALLQGAEPATRDADFLRLMRFMAALKGGFALTAFAACAWRLARPAAFWRGLAYVAGPPLMIVGAFALWVPREPGLAALVLHGGLFAVVAAALTDRDFVPDIALRRRALRASRSPRA